MEINNNDNEIIDFDRITTFWELIKTMDSLNMLPYVMIMGSWAEYLYTNIFNDDFRNGMKTRDIDMLYVNIKKPNNSINFIHAAKAIGFDYYEDPIDKVAKFIKQDILELEFLTRSLGKGSKTSKIEPLNIISESLRVINILEQYPYKIKENGYDLIVPEPSAYVIQKILTNPTRKPEWKKPKDIYSCKRLLNYIEADPYHSTKFVDIYNNLSKKEKQIFDKVTKDENIYIARVLINLDINQTNNKEI